MPFADCIYLGLIVRIEQPASPRNTLRFAHPATPLSNRTVTITEALRITQSVPRDARPFAVTLACGFTPLHLQTFLAAHLQQALPDRK